MPALNINNLIFAHCGTYKPPIKTSSSRRITANGETRSSIKIGYQLGHLWVIHYLPMKRAEQKPTDAICPSLVSGSSLAKTLLSRPAVQHSQAHLQHNSDYSGCPNIFGAIIFSRPVIYYVDSAGLSAVVLLTSAMFWCPITSYWTIDVIHPPACVTGSSFRPAVMPCSDVLPGICRSARLDHRTPPSVPPLEKSSVPIVEDIRLFGSEGLQPHDSSG